MIDQIDSSCRIIDISVIIPLLNEEENVDQLYRELVKVLARMDASYEIIFVDDGSSDATAARLKQIIVDDPHCLIIELTRNFGQTAALAAGFAAAQGGVIVPMDGDLQNDPRDIPRWWRRSTSRRGMTWSRPTLRSSDARSPSTQG